MTVPRGKLYQQLVAEVASAFDPGATVTEGEWVAGPDGRLDMDVAIRGQVDGRAVLAVIECKDFNLESTGKVGREFVDALDSKRHDLGVSIAMICSNSGFTGDALRKAKRKGIGMISVLRRGDGRVKAVIHEQITLRRIRFGQWRSDYRCVGEIPARLGPPRIHLLQFGGRSLDVWLQHRAFLVAKANPSVTEPLRAFFQFKEPLSFDYTGEVIRLIGAAVDFEYKTEWLCQTVRLDAALGMYDYLRGRVRLAPGENQYVIEGVNWETAEPCDPPDASTPFWMGLLPGEMNLQLTMAEGIDVPASPDLPEIEPYVVSEELTRINREGARGAPLDFGT